MSERPMQKAALWYLQEKGWPVIPIHVLTAGGRCTCRRDDCETPGKHPVVAWGGYELNPECKDIEVVTGWWSDIQYNIAIPSGPESGLLFVDFDPKNGGKQTYERLVAEHGEFPTTMVFDTGGKGWQFVFQYPGGVIRSAAPLRPDWPGLDIRAAGGYSVVPPSVHRSGGKYKWRDKRTPATSTVSPLPTWLFTELTVREVQAAGGAKAYIDRAIMPDEGARNNYLSSWLGSWRNIYPREMVEPLAHILAQALGQSEGWLESSLDNLYRKAAIKPPRSQFERETLTRGVEDRRLRLMPVAQAWNPNRPPPKYLLDRLLTEKDIVSIVAPSEMGKSLVALHMALALATGKPAFGKYEVPHRQKVLYVNAENPDGLLLDRIRDICNGMGVKAEDLEEWFFVTEEQRLDLGTSTPDSVVVEEMLQKHDIKLVVLDSLVSFLKGDANSANDVRTWFDSVARNWRSTFNCACIVLHHSKKMGRDWSFEKASDNDLLESSRNSGDIPASCERVFAIWKHAEGEDAYGPTLDLIIRMAKARQGDKIPSFKVTASNPEDHYTIFKVSKETARGKAALVRTLIESHFRAFPADSYRTVEKVLKVIEEGMKCQERNAYKWLTNLRRVGYLKIMGAGDEKGRLVVLVPED